MQINSNFAVYCYDTGAHSAVNCHKIILFIQIVLNLNNLIKAINCSSSSLYSLENCLKCMYFCY